MPTPGGRLTTTLCLVPPDPTPEGVLCPQYLGIPHVQKRKGSRALSGGDTIPGGLLGRPGGLGAARGPGRALVTPAILDFPRKAPHLEPF